MWLTLSVNTLMMLSRCKIKGKSLSIILLASLLNAEREPRSSLYLKQNIPGAYYIMSFATKQIFLDEKNFPYYRISIDLVATLWLLQSTLDVESSPLAKYSLENHKRRAFHYPLTKQGVGNQNLCNHLSIRVLDKTNV